MSTTSRILTALLGIFRPAPRRQGGAGATPAASVSRSVSIRESADAGRHGPAATVEIDPSRVGSISVEYSPALDNDPDPGEIVWTWVPYEERDGRGKDRPVILVAREKAGSLLAVQLTSRDHNGDRGYIDLGTGSWDAAGRRSWANTDRVFRVFADGMRREAALLDAARYALVANALRSRYGWR